jgi:hypothetical protein
VGFLSFELQRAIYDTVWLIPMIKVYSVCGRDELPHTSSRTKEEEEKTTRNNAGKKSDRLPLGVWAGLEVRVDVRPREALVVPLLQVRVRAQNAGAGHGRDVVDDVKEPGGKYS